MPYDLSDFADAPSSPATVKSPASSSPQDLSDFADAPPVSNDDLSDFADAPAPAISAGAKSTQQVISDKLIANQPLTEEEKAKMESNTPKDTRSFGGVLKDFGEDVMEPKYNFPHPLPAVAGKIASFVDPSGTFNLLHQASPRTADVAAAGVADAASDVGSFFTSKAGVGSLLMGGAPKIIQELGGLGFAAQAIKNTPDAVMDFMHAKTDEDRSQALSKVIQGIGIGSAGVMHAGSRPSSILPETPNDSVVSAPDAAAKTELQNRAVDTAQEIEPILPKLPGDTQDKARAIIQKQADGTPLSNDEEATLIQLRSYASQHAENEAQRQQFTSTDEPPATSPIAEAAPAEDIAATPTSPQGGTSSLFARAKAEAAKVAEPLVESADAASDVPGATATAEAAKQAAEVIADKASSPSAEVEPSESVQAPEQVVSVEGAPAVAAPAAKEAAAVESLPKGTVVRSPTYAGEGDITILGPAETDANGRVTYEAHFGNSKRIGRIADTDIEPPKPNEIPATESIPVAPKVESPSEPVQRVPVETDTAPKAAPELKPHQSKFLGDLDTELADEPSAEKSKRSFSVTRDKGDPYFEQDHIIQALMEDGIVSKSASQKKLGNEGFARNEGEYGALPRLANPKHNRLYNPNGRTPDQAVKDLIDAGLVPPNYTITDLAEHIRKTSESAERMRKDSAAQGRDIKVQENQAKNFAKDASAPEHGPAINTGDLKQGDKVKVGDEELEVMGVDEDGNVTLKDGKKYGIQHRGEGETIYGELTPSAESEPFFLDPKELEESANDSKATTEQEAEKHAAEHELVTPEAKRPNVASDEDAQKGPSDTEGQGGAGTSGAEVELPKLRQKEKGTGELFQGSDQPFNLAGEKGTDFQRVADEKSAAEKSAAEAKAKQDREQLDFLTEKPKEPSREDTIAALNRELDQAKSEKRTHDITRLKKRIKALSTEPTAAPETSVESPPEREPWQKTRDEVKAEGGGLVKHAYQVQEALKQGKRVPLDVLESFKGRKWADDARSKLYGHEISNTLLDKILKGLEDDDGTKLYSDPLLLKTMIEHVGKPVLRAAVKIARAGLEGGKVAADAVEDAITYLKANVKGFDEKLGRKFFDPLLNEPKPEKATEQPLPGMEAPKPERAPLVGEDGQRQTSTKNAVVDAERTARGLPPMDTPVRQAVGEVWDKADRALAKDTEAGRKLVQDTLRNPHGPISTEEEAILLRYKVRLQNDIHDAVTTVSDESKSLSERQEARLRAAGLLDENNDLDMATKARGTVWGRLGQFRQQLANEDFTLAPMLQRARVANGGMELPPERIQQITDWQKQYEDLKTKFDAHLSEVERERSERAATNKIKTMMDEAKKTNPAKEKTPEAKKGALSKSVVAFVDSQMEAARQRMRERRQKTFADPLGFNLAMDSADALIIGAGYIVKGTVRFGKWSAEMVKEFGDEIKPHLRDLHDQAKKQADQLKSEAPRDIAAERKSTVDGMKERMKEGDEMPDLARYVQSLAEQFVADGITSRDLLIDAVHHELKQVNPDITRRETMDAISGYGDYKELNPDAIKTQLRDLKGQMQQVAKIEDMEAGEAPSKTGVERRSPSDEERRLTQRVNELKKLGGYIVTDPAKQLKSSLDAIKTRLRNQISDYDHQIATGKKIIREKNAPPSDAETDALRAQRDAKKQEFADIFGKPEFTDEQRIDIATKSLEKNIAEYDKRIADAKAGKFDTKKASQTPETPELTALRARRDAMRAEYDELLKLRKPQPTVDDIAASKAQKGVDAAAAALDHWDRIAKGEIEPETKSPSEPKTNLEEELRSQVNAIKQAYRENTRPKTDVEAKKEEATIKALEKATEEYLRKAREGDLSPKGKIQGPDTARIAAAKAARDSARQAVEDLRKAEKPIRSPDEIALAAFKTRTANRIAELQEKMAKGDFTPKPKPSPIKLDEEGMKLKTQIEKVKLDYDRANMKDMLARRSKTEKLLDFFPKVSRAFLLSSPTTLAKLTAAAAWRMAITPAEEAIGSGLRKLPFVSQVAERAPRQGAGFNVRAESKALTKGVMEGARDAWQLLSKGETELGTLAGKHNIMPREWIDFIGNIHGALKSIPKRNEFERSFQQRTEFNMSHGIDMSDPLVQARTMMESYKDAERAIFQQDNALVSRYNRFLTSLEEKQKATGKPSMGLKTLQAGLKTIFPIVKVPTNIVAEAFDYAAGSLVGSARVARAFKNGIETLKPEDADIIMRQLKKGSLGGAVLALGFLAPQVIGGLYQSGKKRRDNDVKAGGVRLYGQDIPPNLLHAPALEMAQVGSTVRRVADSKLRKRDKDSQGIPAGVLAGGLGLAEEVPFVRDTIELSKAFNPYERGQWANEFAKSRLEPKLLQWAAEQGDRQNGEMAKRKPEGFVETMKTGVPGLREQVPRKKR